MNLPNLPSFSISLPISLPPKTDLSDKSVRPADFFSRLRQSGHISPVSLGLAISEPSSLRAPLQSGKRLQLKNLPLRPSLITIGELQSGHFKAGSAGPRLVIFSASFSLALTSFKNGL